jgi:hypothetical protein
MVIDELVYVVCSGLRICYLLFIVCCACLLHLFLLAMRDANCGNVSLHPVADAGQSFAPKATFLEKPLQIIPTYFQGKNSDSFSPDELVV